MGPIFLLLRGISNGSTKMLSVEDLKTDLSKQNTFKEVKKTLNNLEQGKSRLTKRVGIVETSIVNELHLTKNPPEALVCDCTSNTEIRTYVSSEDRSQIGLLIFPPYEEIIKQFNWKNWHRLWYNKYLCLL